MSGLNGLMDVQPNARTVKIPNGIRKGKNVEKTKICSKCGIEKPLSGFNIDRRARLGIKSYCKECAKISQSSYRYKNKILLRGKRLKYYSENREKALDSTSRSSKKHRSRINDYSRNKHKNDDQYRISSNLKRRVRQIIERIINSKTTETNNLLGCCIFEFKTHIESLFQPGMEWENHGQDGWHIDHSTPIKMFDMTIETERNKCFHYSNLQPLWAEDNRKKGVKVGI